MGNLESLLERLIFEEIPFIFGGQQDLFRTWKQILSHAIDIDPCEIIFTGSSAVGCSLSPVKNFKPFDESSDIDIAIISDRYFSEAWHFLRSLNLATANLLPRQNAAVVEHQKRYVYWGCIATDRILPILPFSQQWMTARSKLEVVQPTIERQINFRIYKDFRALRAYQLEGLKKLQLSVTEINP